jgi:Na+/melibiose symporter-like transporter
MRSFVIVCLMYTFVGTAIAVTQSVLPLFILYSIGLPNGLQRFTEVTIAITAAMILTIIFVSRVGHRFEKRTLFNFGAILSVLVYAGYYFVPGIDNTDPEILRYGIYVFGVFSGIGQALAFADPPFVSV